MYKYTYKFETNDNVIVHVKRRVNGVCICSRYSEFPRRRRDLNPVRVNPQSFSTQSSRLRRARKVNVENVFVFIFPITLAISYQRNFFPRNL